MRYAEVSGKELKFLDMTSLTEEEFKELVPGFEKAYQERMKEYCLDGKKRTGRKYTRYRNSPLPTAEDRLLFILVYVKTNSLQVVQGELFGMGQQKANQWIHALLPVMQKALRDLGDAPARSMEQLAEKLALSTVQETATTAGRESSAPLFAMMEPSGVSSVPKMRMNKKAIRAARKNAIQ